MTWSWSLRGDAALHDSPNQVDTPNLGRTKRISTNQPTSTTTKRIKSALNPKISITTSPHPQPVHHCATSGLLFPSRCGCQHHVPCRFYSPESHADPEVQTRESPRLSARDPSSACWATIAGCRRRQSPQVSTCRACAKNRPPLLHVRSTALGTPDLGAGRHRTDKLFKLCIAILAGILIDRHKFTSSVSQSQP